MKFTRLLTSAFFAAGLVSQAQTSALTTSLSGSHITNNQQLPLTGQLLFTVTDLTDTPVAYTLQGASAATIATIAIPIVAGAVQTVGGYPATLPNLALATPANLRFRMQVQTSDGLTTFYTFPLVNPTLSNFSYDAYSVPRGVTASGMGYPKIPCDPAGLYSNTLATDPYPWVCSKFKDGTIAWTQNPSNSPLCQGGNSQAVVSPASGTPYCIDSLLAYAPPGYVYAGPVNGNAGAVGLIPAITLPSQSGITIPQLTALGMIANSTTGTAANATHAALADKATTATTATSAQTAQTATTAASATYATTAGSSTIAQTAATAATATQFVTTPAPCPTATPLSGGSDIKGNAINCQPVPTGGSGGSATVTPSSVQNALVKADVTSIGSTVGALQAYRQSYVDPTTQSYSYPAQSPYRFGADSPYRIGINDFVSGLTLDVNVGSGYETAILNNGGNNTDASGEVLNFNTHGPIQVGAVQGVYAAHNGTNDLVGRSRFLLCTGVDRADGEGCEKDRDFVGRQNARYGGTTTINSTDSFGHATMRVSQGSGYDITTAASGRVLFDLSAKFAPAGNVSSIGIYSDPRFATMAFDSTLTNAAVTKFGSANFETTLVAGADYQRYNGSCPATAISSSWGTQTGTVNGQSVQVQIDPYNDNPATGGSRTSAMCLTVASTYGMSAGSMIGIWGIQNNWEITKVTTVVDGTHIVVPLNSAHDVGELITGGAGIGWAISSTRNDYPAGYLTNNASNQYATEHTVYPIMRIANGVAELYTNALTGQAEVHLNMYQSLVPAAPFTSITPTVTNGVVTAVSGNSAQGIYGNYQTANTNLPGPLGILPPPTLTYSTGCTTNPVISFPNAGFQNYIPTVVSGGSGCPSNLTITATSTYTNPVVFYPATKTHHVEDSVACPAISGGGAPLQLCPTNGFMQTQALNSTWKTGDVVEIGRHWNYTLNDQSSMHGDIGMQRSGTYGAIGHRFYSYLPSGQALDSTFNMQPASQYFGRPANNYSRTASADPTQAQDATAGPPVQRAIHGAIGGDTIYDQPPVVGFGTSIGGALNVINCVPNQSIPGDDPPCARGIIPDFPIYRVNFSNVPGGKFLEFGFSNSHDCFTIGGACIPLTAGTGGGGVSTPATTNLYKGTGTANQITPASPGVDYVKPNTDGSVPAGPASTNGGMLVSCPSGTGKDTYPSIGTGQLYYTCYQGQPAVVNSSGAIMLLSFTTASGTANSSSTTNTGSDSFTGSGALGSNWTATSAPSLGGQTAAALSKASGVVTAVSGDRGLSYYTGTTWSNDQSSQVVVGAASSVAGFTGPCVRASGGNAYCWVTGYGNAVVALTNGAASSSLVTGCPSVAVGDTVALKVHGTTLTCVDVTQSNASASGTDSSIATGSPGILVDAQGGETGKISSFAGGAN